VASSSRSLLLLRLLQERVYVNEQIMSLALRERTHPLPFKLMTLIIFHFFFLGVISLSGNLLWLPIQRGAWAL